MKKGTRGEVRVQVSAPPEKVYDLVSDITRMGQWSPETVSCEWIDGASGPAVGARFKGTNKRKFARWSTKPTVVAADAPREFAFATKETRWTYRLEPADGGGTTLSESFEMVKDVPRFVAVGERLMGIKDRKADLERGMQETIERIKRVAEGSA
ncbi:MAG: SRPBCC family protein [Acidimicrobiia bacterium]|nr:SRPBCC family protein [Acidimicrobiia bacterium]